MLKKAVNYMGQPLRPKNPPVLVMKLFYEWLSSIRIPLCGYELYPELLQAALSPAHIKAAQLRALFDRMESWQRHCFAYLLCISEQLARNQHLSRRSEEQLAQQISGCLIFTQHPHTREPIHIAEHQQVITALFAFLIGSWRLVFPDLV